MTVFGGVVVPGDRRGRQLGFPTANLAEVYGDQPQDGIYASIVRVGNAGDLHGATVSVGENPTFGDAAGRRIEVHIHDYARGLYGTEVRVWAVRRLRPTMRFSGPAELIRRSAEDIRRSRVLLLPLLRSGAQALGEDVLAGSDERSC